MGFFHWVCERLQVILTKGLIDSDLLYSLNIRNVIRMEEVLELDGLMSYCFDNFQ